jgi:hypothetical protein
MTVAISSAVCLVDCRVLFQIVGDWLSDAQVRDTWLLWPFCSNVFKGIEGWGAVIFTFRSGVQRDAAVCVLPLHCSVYARKGAFDIF